MQCGMLPQERGQPGSGFTGPHQHSALSGPAGDAGSVPLGSQVPAVKKELNLICRKRPDREDVSLIGQLARETVGPGGDHEVVTWISGDLLPDPVGHGDPIVSTGDLIQAVEQDQAPAAAQLAPPPAAGLPAGPAAHRVPDDV